MRLYVNIFFLIYAKITKKTVLPEFPKDATVAIQAIVDGKDVYNVYGQLLPKYAIPSGNHLIISTIEVKKGVDIQFGTGIIEFSSEVGFRFQT